MEPKARHDKVTEHACPLPGDPGRAPSGGESPSAAGPRPAARGKAPARGGLVALVRGALVALAAGAPFFPGPLGSSPASAGKLHDKAAREVLARYAFQADMSVSDPASAPRGWVDARKEPARALRVGTPTALPAPPLGIHAGVFLPSRLSLLRGDHDLVRVHNAALSHWEDGDPATALALLEGANEKAKVLPRSSLERRNLQLLRGHLHLMRHVAFTLAEGPDGENAKEARGKAVGAYSDAFENQDAGGLYSAPGASVDGRVLRSFLARGYFRERGVLVDGVTLRVGNRLEEGATLPISLGERPVDPLANLRSQALPVLWGLAIMKAQNGNWQATFEIALAIEQAFEALGPRAPAFEGAQGTPLLRLYDVDTAANALWILPRRRADMSATLSLVRAAALRQTDDPALVLRFSDEAIRRADDPVLSAAGFHLVASVYAQLGNEPLARKAYDWARAMGGSYETFAPSMRFSSAENHFWAGRRAAARADYAAFLEQVGDKRLGPWASLRLAIIDHAGGDEDAALVRYEKIRRLFPSHPAGTEALVRVFCSPPRGGGARARKALLDEVLSETAYAAPALLEQAKACALDAKLAFTRAETEGVRSRESVVLRSRKLLSQVEEFRSEFPESPFLTLHDDEARRLGLAEGQTILEGGDCGALVGYFRGKGEALFDPALGPARWEDEEKHRLLRCAAMEGALDVWSKGTVGGWEPATREIQSALLRDAKAPSRATGATVSKAFRALWPKADPIAVARDADAAGEALPRTPDFWKLFAASRIVATSLATPGGRKATPLETSRREALRADAGAAHSDAGLCLVAVGAFDAAPRARREAIFASLPAKEWLALLPAAGAGPAAVPDAAGGADAAADPLPACRALLAGKLLAWALEGGRAVPARIRDGLLLPWLEARGPREAPVEWLRYAQGLAARGGARDPGARAAFKRIAKEADDMMARDGARSWLESAAASGEDGR